MFEFHSKIKGTSFRNKDNSVLSSLKANDELTLVCEPENLYDKNAVAVYSGKTHLGYIPKETAPKIRDDVNKGIVKCFVSEITGGVAGRENIGCNILIKVNRPDPVLIKFGNQK